MPRPASSTAAGERYSSKRPPDPREDPVKLSSVRTLLCDMDGVLYRGSRLLPGVPGFLAFLEARGVACACITNNSTLTPEEYEAKLASLGVAVPAQRVVTSALATSRHLRARHPRGTTVYAIGMNGLRQALFADGYFVEADIRPQLVVQGADFEVTYAKLKTACLAIRAGARFVATNPDRTYPSEEGLVPGAGAIGAALRAATDVEPEVVGKPMPTLFRVALEQLGGEPAGALVLGDRLDTDVAGARNAGLASALVLTGVSTRADLERSPQQPDWVFADLPELVERWSRA
jgi:HAD superfamily hydrolase (TIGR01457 family)